MATAAAAATAAISSVRASLALTQPAAKQKSATEKTILCSKSRSLTRLKKAEGTGFSSTVEVSIRAYMRVTGLVGACSLARDSTLAVLEPSLKYS